MRRLVLTICFVLGFCPILCAQLRDSNVHFYINKNWQGSGKAVVYALYFDGYKLYKRQFFPDHFIKKWSTEADLLPSSIKEKASEKNTFINSVLEYSSSYSNQSRTTYYKDDVEYSLIVGQEVYGPRTQTFSDGEYYISVSNDKSEFIDTSIYNGNTEKTYYIEVPRSYLFDKSTRINKSFVNE